MSDAEAQLDSGSKNYRIINLMPVGDYVVIRAEFPDYPEHDRRKVLVFTKKSQGYLVNCLAGSPGTKIPLSPHFSESQRFPSPVACFPLDTPGLKMALFLCRTYKGVP